MCLFAIDFCLDQSSIIKLVGVTKTIVQQVAHVKTKQTYNGNNLTLQKQYNLHTVCVFAPSCAHHVSRGGVPWLLCNFHFNPSMRDSILACAYILQ